LSRGSVGGSKLALLATDLECGQKREGLRLRKHRHHTFAPCFPRY
jgi:hypothetical protein